MIASAKTNSIVGLRLPGTAAQGVVLLALCTVTAVAGLWPVYLTGQFLLLVAVTVSVASILAVVADRFRWPPHLLGVALVVAYLAVGVPVAVPAEALFGVLPTLEGLGVLFMGSVTGWKQLITVTLPAGSFEPLLVPVFLAILFTHTVSLSVALRARRRQWALIGPLTLFLGSIAVGTSAGFVPEFAAAAFAALAVSWLLWCRSGRAEASVGVSSRGRRSVTAVLVVVATIGGGVASAMVTPPDGQRTVLRTAVTQRFNPNDRVSPLSGFRSFHRADLVDAAQLTVSGLPLGARLRLATLSYYDGVVFSVGQAERSTAEPSKAAPGVDGGSFALVPARVDQSGVVGRAVAINVTVDGYSDVWLPTIGALQSVRFFGDSTASGSTVSPSAASESTPPRRGAFYYDTVLRTAAVTTELRRGDRYRLTAILPAQPRAEQLASLRPATADPVLNTADQLTVPAGVRAALERFTATHPTAGAKLQALLGALRDEGYLSHGITDSDAPSRSGHSAGRITEFLSGDRMIGDAEQYAATAAIMAEQLGFPARVVVGFDPARAQPPAQPLAESITVTGADLSAWIEVNTADFGWVSFDPTPPARPVPEQKPEVAFEVARPQTVVPPAVEPPPVPADPPTTGGVPTPSESVYRMPAALVTVLWSGGVLLAILATAGVPVAVIILAKAFRRRSRQRRPGARERVVEAWNEFVDCACDHGFRLPASATRSEIAAVVGGHRSNKLAAWADFAAFAPNEPVTADRCWSLVVELQMQLAQNLSRGGRLAALMSIRSLGWSRPITQGARKGKSHDEL
ncbi:MAG: transglutaminase domain-containing protein [Microbacteriaceae bacterium]|nr:transglutaminase domain-containing protein [Microbacteriaceae bacterium]